jgi:hypothetical protein
MMTGKAAAGTSDSGLPLSFGLMNAHVLKVKDASYLDIYLLYLC